MLVTPVKNEERTIGITIESVIKQTVLPQEWIIVSDESTDGTDGIVREYSVRFPWIRLLALKNRPSRGFGSVVFVTESGINELQIKDYDFIGLLDADVRFDADYFQKLIGRFHSIEGLGLAGGLCLDVGESLAEAARWNDESVAGAVQFFRRDCFESLGGLIAIPEGGWDALTCVKARQAGYKTQTFADLVVDHLKPRNSAEGGTFRRRWQLGVRDYALGYHPLFAFIKYAYRAMDRPPVLGSLCKLGGYFSSLLTGKPHQIPRDLLCFLRREQLHRLGLAKKPMQAATQTQPT